jgi:hypothetical protein
MKRFLFSLSLLMMLVFAVNAQAKKKYPVIKFDKTTVDIGTFSVDQPVQTATFHFRNVGDAKLVINYARASCGCTSVDYPKDFISPGGEGKIVVTYDGSGKYPGHFRRYVQLFTNCKEDFMRLYFEGDMKATAREQKVLDEQK